MSEKWRIHQQGQTRWRHWTLSRTRTLQGTKNMNSPLCNIDMAARMHNFRSQIAVYKPATTEIVHLLVVPAVASSVIEGPKQIVLRRHKRR